MTTPVRSRIAFIGAGHVGSTAAFAMMLRALFAEIVLIDRDPALAIAQAIDLADANAMARPAHIRAGDYADAAAAQIVVITAGAASHGDESRLSLAARSAAIVAECTSALAAHGFGGIIVVASNPVDLMTSIALRHAALPPARVIGTGTLLDTSRLRRALADRLAVAPASIDCLVVGEHGDSEVAALSGIRVGGQPIADFAPDALPDLATIANDVRTAGYRIITGKGFTAFGIATAIVRICEAIVRDERAVLPVSTLLTGQHGIADLCLSLPCIVGAGGIERILIPPLDTREAAALHASANVLRKALADLP